MLGSVSDSVDRLGIGGAHQRLQVRDALPQSEIAQRVRDGAPAVVPPTTQALPSATPQPQVQVQEKIVERIVETINRVLFEEEGFHDGLTPVNAFRIIFNARFGTDLPLLPDRVWTHEDLSHFYDFFEITDRLQR